jgi:hypothetical protein
VWALEQVALPRLQPGVLSMTDNMLMEPDTCVTRQILEVSVVGNDWVEFAQPSSMPMGESQSVTGVLGPGWVICSRSYIFFENKQTNKQLLCVCVCVCVCVDLAETESLTMEY